MVNVGKDDTIHGSVMGHVFCCDAVLYDIEARKPCQPKNQRNFTSLTHDGSMELEYLPTCG